MSIYFEYIFRKENIVNLLDDFTIMYSTDKTKFFNEEKINIFCFKKHKNYFLSKEWDLSSGEKLINQQKYNDIDSFFQNINPNKLLKFKENTLKTNFKEKLDDFHFDYYYCNLLKNNIDYAMQIADRLYLLSPKNVSEWKEALSTFPKEQTAIIFALSDALIEKKYEEALKIYSILLEEGLTVENILYYLINHYSFLCEVKLYSLTYKTKKEILSVMRDQNTFRVEKAFLQIKKVSFKSLNKALSSLIKIEKDFKSGQLTNISNELPLFISGSK